MNGSEMDTSTGILLGVIQGLAEFLPISSSGHLVIFQNLLGFREPELVLDSALHFGTLLAVFIYFRSDLKCMIMDSWKFGLDVWGHKKKFKEIHDSPHASLALWVLVGTIPTALIGVVFRSSLEEFFGSVTAVGMMLVFTGILLAFTKPISNVYGNRENLNLYIALAVGVCQGLAIIPGISRSGATIVCGMLCKLRRDVAARFSFLLSIPAITGALVIQLSSTGFERVGVTTLLFGVIVSALVGLFALKILMGMVTKGRLFYFAPYCWLLGLAAMMMS
ncbi:undecaprenyl-diphosphate phosphatase [Thermodesulfobacteriota bacterium]